MTEQQAARPQVRITVYVNLILALLNLGVVAILWQSGRTPRGIGAWYMYLSLGFGLGFMISAILIGAYLLIGLLLGLLVNGLFLTFALFTFIAVDKGDVNIFNLLPLLSILALFYIIKYLLDRTQRAAFR